ncbi:PAS domain S-box protein [Oscillatoriales cyanobacterium LEGE 11467]|uniref:Adenylate cyclase n=2 Tax=Zarconia TaxID=2992130 RepID=A0A928VWH6_9CYAN|nr:PAS domain S-box protein [Zarconia navalis LEGE 11467]
MSSFNREKFVPPHVEYIILNSDLRIVRVSGGSDRFVEDPRQLDVETEIGIGFPELFGLEEIFSEVLHGDREQFVLKGIVRHFQPDAPIYLDIYAIALGQHGDRLILFLEEVTDRMTLEQTLVQASNEMMLLVDRLSVSEAYTESIVMSMADALLVTDLSGTIQKVNPATIALLGYEKSELVGQHFLSILDDPNFDIAEIQRYLLAEDGEILKNVELVCRCRNGENVTIAFSCSVIPNQGRDWQELIYIGRDVTKQLRAQQRTLAQLSITQTLSEAIAIEDAMPKILQGICEHLHWDLGELWLPDTEPDKPRGESPQNVRLSCVAAWSDPSVDLSQWMLAARQKTFTPQEGIPGQIWQRGKSEWIADWVRDRRFKRTASATTQSLRCACGFPIQIGNETIGVMTLFSQEVRSPDRDLLRMMTLVGGQLGQFIQRKRAEAALSEQREQTERLLLNILPEAIADRLKQEEGIIAEDFEEVTVLFADIVGFTELSAQISATDLVRLLNQVFSAFDKLSEKHGLEKIKTIGDAYMVVGGLPKPIANSAVAIAQMALEMQQAIVSFNARHHQQLSLRIGIHTGPVVAGVIGIKKFNYDLWGDTVNTASRMESHGVPGKIQVTEAIYRRICDRFVLEKRGTISVKGKGKMTTYFLVGRKENLANPPQGKQQYSLPKMDADRFWFPTQVLS